MMKTFEPTIEAVAAPENLLRAWRNVRGNIPRYRRARSAGVDGVSIEDFEQNLSVELEAIRHSLLRGHYNPQPMQRVLLPKPAGGHREIGILTVGDRVAQRAVQQVIEAPFENKFLPCSYGFRPGLSTMSAVEDVKSHIAKGEHWMVNGDIENCFQTLEHRKLMNALQAEIKDRRIIQLLEEWLDENVEQAGPPEAGDWLSSALIKTTAKVQEGIHWTADTLLTEQSGYPTYLPETDQGHQYDAYEEFPITQTDAYLRERAIKRMVMGGVMMGASWLRPLAESALHAIGTAAVNPISRNALKKGALAVGGVAGLIAVTGAAAYLVHHQTKPSTIGVLQGSPLSPLMANIYLNEFDHQMMGQQFHLVRYADDWIITCGNQRKAEQGFNIATQILATLKLRLNLQKTHIICPNEPIQWLGIKVR